MVNSNFFGLLVDAPTHTSIVLYPCATYVMVNVFYKRLVTLNLFYLSNKTMVLTLNICYGECVYNSALLVDAPTHTSIVLYPCRNICYGKCILQKVGDSKPILFLSNKTMVLTLNICYGECVYNSALDLLRSYARVCVGNGRLTTF
jgi:hypothetical protein